MNRIIIVIGCMMLAVTTVAQMSFNKADKSALVEDLTTKNKSLEKVPLWELKTNARIAEKKGMISSAVQLYEGIFIRTQSYKTALKLGELNYKLKQYYLAFQWFQAAYYLNSTKAPEALFHLANINMIRGNNERAKANLDDYLASGNGKYRSEARELQRSWKKRNSFLENEKNIFNNIEIKRAAVAVNNPYAQSAPVFLSNEEILISSVPADSMRHTMDNSPGRLFLKVKPDQDWSTAEFAEIPVGTSANPNNAAFNHDRSVFFFTDVVDGGKKDNQSRIYMVHKEKKQWSTPFLLPEDINLKNFTSTQPAVGYDRKLQKEVLYFVSDRPGGKGGMDIWYVYFDAEKKTFSKPRNAGAKINSIGNEMTPFVHPVSNDFYFSSDGHFGYGGLDIFKSKGAESRFYKPVNMGQKINSPVDDIYFVLNEKQDVAYMVSNRSDADRLGTCCDDLFVLRIGDDKNTVDESFDAEFVASEDIEFEDQRVADFVTARTSLVLDNIHYEFNKADLTQSAKETIDELLLPILKRYDDIVIEIGSHTDNIGTETYNMKLSQERAQSVVNYLLSKGIDEQRLIAVGYGESMPLASNINADQTDNPEGRQKNRRTEFRVISSNMAFAENAK